MTKHQDELKEAIDNKNLLALKMLAQQMGDDFTTLINTPLVDYNTPLIAAVATGAKEIVTYLLGHGAAINEKALGETVLIKAAEKGDAAMVEILLTHKPDVNAKSTDDGRFSALYWAAWRGHAAIVSLLLSAKAKVDIKTSDRETPLYTAAQNGHFNIVKLLVENGAKINMICSDGNDTALCAACSGDHLDIVKYLLDKGANPNGINDKTLDFYAFPLASTRSGAVASLLLAAGAAVHARGRSGQDTALHRMVRRTNYPDTQGIKREKLLQAIEVLLAHGADPLAKNDSHINTPLALSESRDVMALLKDAIARKNPTH